MKAKPKFSLAQAASDTSGRTSASKAIGLFLGFIAGLSFIFGVVDCFIDARPDIMTASFGLAGLSAALIGSHKYLSSKYPKADPDPKEGE